MNGLVTWPDPSIDLAVFEIYDEIDRTRSAYYSVGRAEILDACRSHNINPIPILDVIRERKTDFHTMVVVADTYRAENGGYTE